MGAGGHGIEKVIDKERNVKTGQNIFKAVAFTSPLPGAGRFTANPPSLIRCRLRRFGWQRRR